MHFHQLLTLGRFPLIFLIMFSPALLACGGGGDSKGGSSVPLSQNSCGTVSPKIFGGTACIESGLPIVEIKIHFRDGKTGLCSGSLVAPTFVLTAGHCFHGDPSTVEGTLVINNNESVSGQSILIDPDYRESQALGAIFGDAALLELSGPFQNASYLPLFVSEATHEGQVIDIFGFGLDEQGSLEILKSGQMLLANVTVTHLTAEYDGLGSNACLGDSGGPAVRSLNGVPGIVGIISTGTLQSECRPGDVSLFTNIQDPSIQNFIFSHVPEIKRI